MLIPSGRQDGAYPHSHSCRQGGAHLGLFGLVSAQFWGTTVLAGQQLQTPDLAHGGKRVGGGCYTRKVHPCRED